MVAPLHIINIKNCGWGGQGFPNRKPGRFEVSRPRTTHAAGIFVNRQITQILNQNIVHFAYCNLSQKVVYYVLSRGKRCSKWRSQKLMALMGDH